MLGIVYATKSKMIRRIIWSDDNGNLTASNHCGLGESFLLADSSIGGDLFAAQRAVKAAAGVDPPHHVCAILGDNGVVEHLIPADPELDSVPGKMMVLAAATVAVGHVFDAKTKSFRAPPLKHVIPPGRLDKP